MNEERLTALSLAIETGTDMHFDKEELEWLIAAARERNEWYDNAIQERVRRVKAEKKNDTLRASNAALTAHIVRSCDAMLEIIALDPDDFMPKWRQIAEDAFARTPADSLREYKNGVLEEVDKRILTCCSVCSDGIVNGQDCPSCTVLRLTVRAMKADT